MWQIASCVVESHEQSVEPSEVAQPILAVGVACDWGEETQPSRLASGYKSGGAAGWIQANPRVHKGW
jgi:hypothetical protein